MRGGPKAFSDSLVSASGLFSEAAHGLEQTKRASSSAKSVQPRAPNTVHGMRDCRTERTANKHCEAGHISQFWTASELTRATA